ncbi:uncharacterized protein LOC142335130 [Convolutriloba macropyga]|uniref:uncharacterized protein LOC142335130 n=1 Tax=Convolutriloba macropyga TaxID=536237 RepID=UPI003F51CE3F
MGLKSFDIYLANYSEFGCKLYYYHSWASTIDASWHLIALALDRAVSIIFPVWHRSLDIARSSRNISWSLTFATYFIVLPNLYFFKIDANNDTCTMIPGNLQQPMLLYIGVITLGLFSFLPFVLIFFANVVFIRKIYILRSEKKDRENQMSVRMSLLRNNTVEQYSLPAMELTEKQPEKSRERDNHNNSNDEKGAEKFNAVTTKNFGDQRVGSSYYEFNPNSAGRPKTSRNDGYLNISKTIRKSTKSKENSSTISRNDGYLNISKTSDNQAAHNISKISKNNALIEVISFKQTSIKSSQEINISNDGSLQKVKMNFPGDMGVIITLMIISCTFLAFTLAAALFNKISQTTFIFALTPNEKAFSQLMAEIMAVLNNSLNFLFYYISGKLFRATFKNEFITPVFNRGR